MIINNKNYLLKINLIYKTKLKDYFINTLIILVNKQNYFYFTFIVILNILLFILINIYLIYSFNYLMILCK